MLKLHNYYRSGSSQRVRIALELKGLDYEYVPVNLLKGEHRGDAYGRLQPQNMAPALDANGQIIIQSPAILEWLEEVYPQPALLPDGPIQRARVRAMAMIIGCDVHPLNNLRILNAVKEIQGTTEPPKEWISRWIGSGFAALERMLGEDDTRNLDYCFGQSPGLVECYLIPQVYSAKRFGVDLSPFPLIRHVDAACSKLPAFIRSAPENQPDCLQPE